MDQSFPGKICVGWVYSQCSARGSGPGKNKKMANPYGGGSFFDMIDPKETHSGNTNDGLHLQINDEPVAAPTGNVTAKPTHKKKKSASVSPKKRGSVKGAGGGGGGLVDIPYLDDKLPASAAASGHEFKITDEQLLIQAVPAKSHSTHARKLPTIIMDLTWDRIYVNIDVPLPMLTPVFEDLRDYRVIKAWHVSSKSPRLWSCQIEGYPAQEEVPHFAARVIDAMEKAGNYRLCSASERTIDERDILRLTFQGTEKGHTWYSSLPVVASRAPPPSAPLTLP